MYTRLITSLRLVSLTICLLFATQTQADVFNVSQTAIKGNISLQSTTVTIRWRMEVDLGCGDTSPVRVYSDSATVGYTPGPRLTPVTATVYKSLSKIVSIDARAGSAIVVFYDSVQIPQHIIIQAINAGITQIAVVRQFRTPAGSGCPGSGGLTANITGSSATGFTVNRQSMRFNDDSIVKLLNSKEALKAKSEIYYSGAGQIRGYWEVAGPSTGSGIPIFRRLSYTQKSVVSGERVTLFSPNLPTSLAGAYMVRLRLTSPVPGFESPVIRYFVGTRGAALAPPIPMRLGNPVDRAWLNRDTHFRWQGVKGALFYRLEFYGKPAETDIARTLPSLGGNQGNKKPIRLKGRPVAGVMLPGSILVTGLSRSAYKNLAPGRWYYWRIVAIGKNGKIVGLSPIREARIP